jgi:Concanavalin A-like lectin/glucanases superfamily
MSSLKGSVARPAEGLRRDWPRAFASLVGMGLGRRELPTGKVISRPGNDPGARHRGCWLGFTAFTLFLMLFPAWFARCYWRPGSKAWQVRMARLPELRPAPAGRAVTVEAWVRLRSFRGCPVLVERGGYRLGVLCDATGGSAGWLAFAGPFAGHAYVSEEAVPLKRWVHLAGTWDGRGADLLIDGQVVTAGRIAEGGPALPLGRDPWAAAPYRPTAAAGRGGGPARLDGEVGDRRAVWRPRSASHIAGTRGHAGLWAAV